MLATYDDRFKRHGAWISSRSLVTFAGDAEPGPPIRPEPTTPIVRRGEDGWGGAAAGPAKVTTRYHEGAANKKRQEDALSSLP